MPTFDLYSSAQRVSTWRARRMPIHPFAAAWILITSWVERARQRNALAELDDTLLRDIGITRVEAARECGKPFWR